jgi:hypothetical protein
MLMSLLCGTRSSVSVLQGHFQVVFSRKHCPLFQWRLGFFMRVRPPPDTHYFRM